MFLLFAFPCCDSLIYPSFYLPQNFSVYFLQFSEGDKDSKWRDTRPRQGLDKHKRRENECKVRRGWRFSGGSECSALVVKLSMCLQLAFHLLSTVAQFDDSKCDVCQFVGKHRTSHFASFLSLSSSTSTLYFSLISMNCLSELIDWTLARLLSFWSPALLLAVLLKCVH